MPSKLRFHVTARSTDRRWLPFEEWRGSLSLMTLIPKNWTPILRHVDRCKRFCNDFQLSVVVTPEGAQAPFELVLALRVSCADLIDGGASSDRLRTSI